MNFNQLQSHNLGLEKAFETLCNQLFENYCMETYSGLISHFKVVNGAGGDGGVESYLTLKDGKIIGLQAKWFLQSINNSQFNQIKKSVKTAMKIRPKIVRYIVCIPRNLADTTGKNINSKSKQKTETESWEELKNEFATMYPKLSLEIWTEYDLLKELQKVTNQGVKKYWFDNSILNFDTIDQSFEKQKAGWLAQRFLEDLHINGIISEKLDYFLGEEEVFKENIEINDLYIDLANKLLSDINEYLQLKKINDKNKKALSEVQVAVNANIQVLKKMNQSYLGVYDAGITEGVDQRLSELFSDFEENARDYYTWYVSLMRKKINKLDSIVLRNNDIDLYFINKLIVLGDRGTGKTHGIANKIKEINGAQKHTAILIQASRVNCSANWKDIILNELGLSSDWSEDELFNALQALAHSNDTRDKNLNSSIKSKILICVDGLDEIRPYDCWANIINQTKAISGKFPRIRFNFTSRPYVFRDEELRNFEKVVYLRTSDVPVIRLFDSYIKKYNVDIVNKRWIKGHLKTPILLRLFCEKYKNQSLETMVNNNAFIMSLFDAKIKQIEADFCKKYSEFSIENECIKKALIYLAEFFIKNHQISVNNAIDLLKRDIIFKSVSGSALKAINFLCETGILASFVTNADSIKNRITNYYINSQPILDYVFALLIYQNDLKDLKNAYSSIYNKSVMELLAILYFSEKKILLSHIEKFNRISDIFYYDSYALVNCPDSISKEMVIYITNTMLSNTNNFMLIVNYVFLDSAQIENHPFSPSLLNKILKDFKTPVERDLFFALPSKWKSSYGYKDNETKWDHDQELRITEEQYILSAEDNYNNLPLIYSWALTFLDNEIRSFARNNLYKWAANNPKQFNKLFYELKDVNDPQMRSDIYSIAMSMSYALPADNTEAKTLANEIFEDIFVNGNLIKNKDISIRYYAEQICEKAFLVGVFSKEQMKIVHKKEVALKDKISLHKKAFNTKKDESYEEVDYDLTRYVLCEPLNNLFFEGYNNHKLSSKAKHLLNEYAFKYSVEELDSSGFIMAAAYQFLLNCGYCKKLCEEHYSDGKQSNIAYRYGGASHGSKSKIFSIIEKYIWCAKNYILGYLADNLNYKNRSTDKISKSEHYTDMENFIVPYQEVAEQEKPLSENNRILLPHPLNRPKSPKLGKTVTDINSNIMNNTPPEFEKFVHILGENSEAFKSDNYILYQNSFNVDDNLGTETSLWIASGLIKDKALNALVSDIRGGNISLQHDLLHPDYFRSYSESWCYLNPSDICSGTLKGELFMSLVNKSGQKYKIFYTTEKCTADISLKGDTEYSLPSMAIRNNCGITKGNGYEYFNSNNDKIASFYCAGIEDEDYQEILAIEKAVLELYLKKKN